MGLGKTIEALALILAHKPPDGGPRTTLVIAPLALLKQWDREIASKVKEAHMLTTIIYHGRQKKNKKTSRLHEHDVVITTYETVASEYRAYLANRRRDSLLFGSGNRFYRIILDEAHKIKNRRAACSEAVVELDAKYRLCMTGTPFMNNAAEIFPLLRFLHIKPYSDWPFFNEHIARPLSSWVEDEHAEAMRKVQVLFRSIHLRRTKDSYIDGRPIIKLPELNSHTITAVFNPDQKTFYDALEQKQQIRVNKYLKQGRISKVYTFILVLLLRLRQTCCHPYLIKDHGIPDEAQLDGRQMVQLAMKLDQRVADRILWKRTFQCPLCDSIAENPIIIFPCGHDICSECFSGMMRIVLEAKKNPDESLAGYASGDEGLESSCPHEGCDTELNPRKIICHSFFLDAHPPGGSHSEAGDSSDLEGGDDRCISDHEFCGEYVDDGEDLKGFIVSDNDEGSQMDSGEEDDDDESERRFKYRARRPPTPNVFSGCTKFLDKDEHEGDHVKPDKRVKAESKPARHKTQNTGDGPPRNQKSSVGHTPAPSERDRDSAGGSARRAEERTPAEDEGQGSGAAAYDPWAAILARYRAAKNAENAKREAVSDRHHAASSEGGQGQVGVAEVKPQAASTDIPSQSTVKRKRVLDHEKPLAPSKRIKKNGNEAAPPKRHKAESAPKEKKKKKKRRNMTLGELRKTAASSKSAKAKYFARLRKDYESSAKIDATLDLLRSIRRDKPTEKTLVFSLWTSFLDLLEIPLRDEGFRYLRYDGGMSFNERDDSIRQFSESPGVKILLVSLMAGNAGLNLTAASQVIILGMCLKVVHSFFFFFFFLPSEHLRGSSQHAVGCHGDMPPLSHVPRRLCIRQ